MNKYKDITGKTFGDITVLNISNNTIRGKGKHCYWDVKCSCGIIFSIRSTSLKDNKDICCRKCSIKKRPNYKHGMTNTRLFNIWQGMKERCYNIKSKPYRIYGGRGIKMCDNWKGSFINFYDWSINNGYADNLTIDRINNNGNYEPDNCKWSTRLEQANNTSKNHLITYNGKTQNIKQWSIELGLQYNPFRNRLAKNNYDISSSICQKSINT